MNSNEIRFDCRHRGDGGPLVIVPRIDGAPRADRRVRDRETRDYVAFGPFQFDRHHYDDALRALSAVIGSDVEDTRA